MLIKPADKVIFADDEIEKNFNNLSNDIIKKVILRAKEKFKANVFCGQSIKKNIIPKIYISKYSIDNLWWYPLPDGWRLVYSVITPSRDEILAVIIEWFDHKGYERRFRYG